MLSPCILPSSIAGHQLQERTYLQAVPKTAELRAHLGGKAWDVEDAVQAAARSYRHVLVSVQAI